MSPRQEQTKDACFRAWMDFEAAHGEILATPRRLGALRDGTVAMMASYRDWMLAVVADAIDAAEPFWCSGLVEHEARPA